MYDFVLVHLLDLNLSVCTNDSELHLDLFFFMTECVLFEIMGVIQRSMKTGSFGHVELALSMGELIYSQFIGR